MNQNIPIFCINLRRAKERRQLIEDEWIAKLGFNILFFEAFDRKEIDENNNFIYEYHPKNAILKIKRPLNTGEIACATSFGLLTEVILKLGIDKVIIMEDDISPLFKSKDDFFYILNQGIEEYPNSEAFIMHKPLSNWLWEPSDDKFYERKQYFSLLKRAPYGTQFIYFNSRQGIQKYHDAVIKMQYPADLVWNDIFTPDKTMVYANNPLVSHDNTSNSTTYIGNEYRGIKRRYIND